MKFFENSSRTKKLCKITKISLKTYIEYSMEIGESNFQKKLKRILNRN